MRQHLVVDIVDRLRDAHGCVATSSDVVEALSNELGVDVDLADVSRTLLRAMRNGRLWRRAGHTDPGNWFRYEYGVTRKGVEWLHVLASPSDGEAADDPDADAPSPPEDGKPAAGAAWERCGDCRTAVAPEDRFCRMCGTKFEACDSCGSPLMGGECPAGCE